MTVQISHSVYYVNVVSKLLINCSNGNQSLVVFTTGSYSNVTFGDPDETFKFYVTVCVRAVVRVSDLI